MCFFHPLWIAFPATLFSSVLSSLGLCLSGCAAQSRTESIGAPGRPAQESRSRHKQRARGRGEAGGGRGRPVTRPRLLGRCPPVRRAARRGRGGKGREEGERPRWATPPQPAAMGGGERPTRARRATCGRETSSLTTVLACPDSLASACAVQWQWRCGRRRRAGGRNGVMCANNKCDSTSLQRTMQ